jgi:glycosyltransferase involved in cell wall biosynthesis
MRPRFSVVIATFNRAGELRRTLESLSRLRTDAGWELIVVDNNSTDDTARVVHDVARQWSDAGRDVSTAASDDPIPIRYVLEKVQGRSAALNAGIKASCGNIIVTTDDDVRVEPDWLERAGAALERLQCGYIGGRVLPLWGAPPPAWLSDRGGPHWAVIALLDYGPTSIELTTRMPLGVNMAFRREVFEVVGGWDVRVGRKAGTLLGQEVREWCIRARAKGVRGFYVPELMVRHVIPADRLSKRYFRRWFYWRGISRALLFQQQGLDMESPQETRHDFRRVPMIAGVPRYLYRVALRHAAIAIWARLRGRRVESFEAELWLWMFAGILHQRWRDRHNAVSWLPTGNTIAVPPAPDANPARDEAGSSAHRGVAPRAPA